MFIELLDGVKKYGQGDAQVFAMDEVRLTINKGEICVILGPSGSGKSTLMNMLGGIDRMDSGKLLIDGKAISELSPSGLTEYRRSDVGFVFQFYNLIQDLTVLENIQVVSDIAAHPLPIDEVVESLGLGALVRRFPSELSGGQQQRTAIARAIIKNPKLLLCDELTGALDSKSSKEILQYIEKVNKTLGMTILIVTHNEAIRNIADRVILLRDGRIVSNEPNKDKVRAEDLAL
ncbi:MAG: ABC transporter ATP-binding protein [Oscillospiraceae bacterium]|nr:ABC transporter ATP-binding protein [Oscillospiraceae bacterium]